ncbi:MAG TPA: DUF4292 domain-containing protein [Salinivirgaceae bacterium]|nr:DUF4292 domain-containing protein [Salinivirgaceae bacterium]
MERKELISIITANHPILNTISIKSNINFVRSNITNSFNANIRIKKDSLIWISISAPLGIELARGLFERDSFTIVNYHEKTYFQGSYSSLKKYTRNDLNFNFLQNFLTASFINEHQNYFYSLHDTLFVNDDDKYVMESKIDDFNTTIKVDAKSFKISELNLSKDLKIILEICYDKYVKIDGFLFPHKITVCNNNTSNPVSLTINYNNVVFNKEFKAPFRIPKKYEQANFK